MLYSIGRPSGHGQCPGLNTTVASSVKMLYTIIWAMDPLCAILVREKTIVPLLPPCCTCTKAAGSVDQ